MKIPKGLYNRRKDTHKGDYGYVLIVGGSVGLTGAVCLCANASLKIGAGLVRVAVPASLNNIFEIKLTEVMSLPLADKEGYLSLDGYNLILEVLDKIDVIVLGPGASTKESVKELFFKILYEIDKPFVIDADGINLISSDVEILKKRRSKDLVITPHLKEFSRLTKLDIEKIKKDREKLVKDFAFRYNLVCVLKGHNTLVSDGKRIFKNTTGNPGMAKAGSGDVLTGMIAGLIAQRINILDSAKFAVYLHGLAGDLAAKDKTQMCLVASDIIDKIPEAIKRCI